MKTNHNFKWLSVNDTGPIYECTVCSGTLLINHKSWSTAEFQRGDYQTPPSFLNELPNNKTCEEVMIKAIHEE